MNTNTANPSSINDSPVSLSPTLARCKHHTRTGRCRLPVADPHSTLCPTHALRHKKRRDSAATTAFLTSGLSEFKSPESINEFLSRLLLALAEERIAPRRAAVLAYITNQLLHSQRAIEHANSVIVIEDPPRLEPGDIPRPDHTQPRQPS